MKKIVRLAFVTVFVLVAVSFSVASLHAQVTPTATPTPDNSSTISDLEKQIQALQGKITDLQGQEKTLSSQIAVFDSQIQLTQLRIQDTQQKILNLTMDIDTASTKIDNLQGSIDNLTKVLLNRIVSTYEVGSAQPFQLLVSSSDIKDFFTRANYLRIAQAHDKQLIYNTVQAKNDYANQKQIYEDEKKQVEALNAQLQAYTQELDQEKAQKKQLLADTQGSEASYQHQLANAKAQLAALAGFATARSGGVASIIPHSDMSDGWGKYYNQRDANWGNNLIGYSSYPVWEVGCLLTSYAMVSSHYGSVVTPGDVAANNDNFALGTAYFRLPGPAPAGHSVNYVQNPSTDQLKNALQSGSVIIAGLSADGGPSPSHYSDHWVVLRGVGGDGSFLINDPWYAGAMGVSLNDHYSGWAIIEARIYN